jgi:nucleoside-diphosphate-sugar epimerase
MKPIAIIGAGGYVGSRLVERSELLGTPPLVSIVRGWRSQGRLARFGLRTVRGDAGDSASLAPLLKGAGMAVNLTMGDDTRILSDVRSIHAACVEAGVPVLVHVSSAEVFGRAEQTGLTEDSAPDGRHWMEYGRAKAAAEAWLRERANGPVKIVILRPGLIWGPGSGWLVAPAQALIDGTAFLFGEGRGVCNLIHVDNLIEHLVELARSEDVESGVFNISDPETLTWAQYYRAIARETGADDSAISMLGESSVRAGRLDAVMALTKLAPARAIKRRMSGATKVRIKQQLQDRLAPPITRSEPVVPAPAVSKQLWWLHGTASKLPTGAFAQRYPGLTLRSFPELMAAAGQWLRYSGFETVNDRSSGDPRRG